MDAMAAEAQAAARHDGLVLSDDTTVSGGEPERVEERGHGGVAAGERLRGFGLAQAVGRRPGRC